MATPSQCQIHGKHLRSRRLHVATHGFGRGESEEATQGGRCYDLEDLSDTEKSRLFRGFYKFMIYGNLFFYDNKRKVKDAMHAYEQCENFLCLFPSWQVEELSCINDFVTEKVLEKWQEVEENAYNALIAADPSTWELEKLSWHSRWEFDSFRHPKKSSNRNHTIDTSLRSSFLF
jgi:hypothetical protein